MHYPDANEIYQRILKQNPKYLALHVYIAMYQFKLDQWQESNESVDQYLGVNSDSAVGLNLKACGYLRLYDPEIAESQLLQIRKFSSSSYTFIDSLIIQMCITIKSETEVLDKDVNVILGVYRIGGNSQPKNEKVIK